MTVGGLHIQAPLARRSRAGLSGIPAGRGAGAPVRISPAGPGPFRFFGVDVSRTKFGQDVQKLRPGDLPGLSQSCAGMIGGMA